MERVYVYSLIDTPGVVAANNFLSFFMPANSPKFGLALLVDCTNYSTGLANQANSMEIQRTSAASGGSLVQASTIPRFVATDEDPVMQVRTGNPAVTSTRIPLVGYPPPISNGAGSGSGVSQVAPQGASFTILPGTGLVFFTMAGLTTQMWNMQFAWQEIYLPPSS